MRGFRKKKLLAGWLLCLVLFMCMAGTFAFPARADGPKAGGNSFGDENFEGRIVVGLENNWRLGAELPVTVYLTSKKADFEGNIRLIIPKSEYGFTGIAFEKPIMLKMGEEKVITQAMSGNMGSGVLYMQLVDDKGKVLVEKVFNVSQTSASRALIGVLSDDFTGLNYFDGLPISFNDIGYVDSSAMLELDEKTFPSQATSLNVLSYIIIDHFDTSRLSAEQYEALKKWVASGGVLIVGTGADYKETLSIFKDDFLGGSVKEGKSGTFSVVPGDLPVIQEVQDGGDLPPGFVKETEEAEESESEPENPSDGSGKQENGQNQGTEETAPIVYSSGDGFVEISLTGGRPLTDVVTDSSLIWTKNYESGTIIVTSWDFTMRPVFDHPLRTSLAAKILQEAPGASSKRRILEVNYGNQGYVDDANYLNLLHYALDPGLPNTSLLTFVLIAFLLVSGPGLYVFLKKADKRELLWILIPAAAIAWTAAIFLITTNLRMNAPVASSITVIKYDQDSETGENIVSKKVTTSLLLPNVGNAHLEMAPEISSLKLETDNDFYYGNGPSKELDYDTIIRESAEGFGLEFHNNSTFQYKELSSDLRGGNEAPVFEMQLKNEMAGLSGSVTNLSPDDLDYVFVVSGKSVIVKKDVKKGQSFSWTNADNISMDLNYMYDFSNLFVEEFAESERRMVGSAVRALASFTRVNNESIDDEVYVLGFKYDWDADYIKTKNVKEKNMALYACHQAAPLVDFEGGIRFGLFDFFMGTQGGLDDDGQLYEQQAIADFTLGEDITRVYALTRSESTGRGGYSEDTVVYAMNYENGRYERLFADGDKELFKDGKCPYVGKDHEMSIRYNCPTPYECRIPTINLIGGLEDAEY